MIVGCLIFSGILLLVFIFYKYLINIMEERIVFFIIKGRGNKEVEEIGFFLM